MLTETEAVGVAAALESVLQHLLLRAHVAACRSDPKGGGVIHAKHLDLAVRKPADCQHISSSSTALSTAPVASSSNSNARATAQKGRHPPEEGDTNLALLFPRGCSVLARSGTGGGGGGGGATTTAQMTQNPFSFSPSQPLQGQIALEQSNDFQNGNNNDNSEGGGNWHPKAVTSPTEATVMAVQQAYQSGDVVTPTQHPTDDNDDNGGLPHDSSSSSSSSSSSRSSHRGGGNGNGGNGGYDQGGNSSSNLGGSPVKLTASALAGHNAGTASEAAEELAAPPPPEPVSRYRIILMKLCV